MRLQERFRMLVEWARLGQSRLLQRTIANMVAVAAAVAPMLIHHFRVLVGVPYVVVVAEEQVEDIVLFQQWQRVRPAAHPTVMLQVVEEQRV